MIDSPRDGHHIAVLLIDPKSMRIVWCNDTYAEHLARVAPGECIGKSYEEALPMMSPIKLPMFRRVAETGVSERGTDYNVDLGSGSSARHWQTHKINDDLLIAIINWD